MPEDTRDELDQQLQKEQIDRLVLNARVFLRQQRVPQAQAAIDELRQLQPDSSEACELQGDLHRQQGKRKAAGEAYQRAFELDATNANAERKYAEVVLFLGEEDRARRKQREIVDDPEKHKPHKRNPALAIMYGCFFPGLGQLYNRQHEKGLALFVVGALLLILLFNSIILGPLNAMKDEARGRGLSFLEQLDLWSVHLRATPWWHWMLAILGVIVVVSLHLYGIVDAGVVARREAKEADRLGIEAPS